jgi:hypothetical protein
LSYGAIFLVAGANLATLNRNFNVKFLYQRVGKYLFSF